ncbi:MAG: aminotransferase class I/II-fold pyridoxal phosphate-dependent enzyme [Treponema sp.]|jgi:histidinol-phosphate aminotransferase|nr:aminotransferase class I/II-fold pyridoxal phosphate-dependent enzyme [Treponema sp.]
MSVFWNSRTRGLSPYVPGDQPKDRAFIKLNTNENPYPPSPKAVETMRRLLNGDDGRQAGDSLRLYPDPLCGEFCAAAAKAYSVAPDQVFPGNGSDEVLAFAFGAFFETGSSAPPVLFPDITYSFYPVYARLWGIPFREVPLADDFSLHTGDYLVPSGGAVIPNPNAPTGRAVSAFGGDGIEALAAFLLEQNKVLVVDEAYAAFGAESTVPLTARFSNLLTVHTLSKSASLAGLRAGFAIGSAELVKGLFRIRDSFNSYTMDRLALVGAAAAVSDRAYYDTVNARVIAARERSSAALKAMGFEVVPSKSNFLFARYKDGGGILTGAFLLKALRDRGILVRHFDKPRTADYIRVSIGTDDDMDAFLAACRDIISA